MRAFKGLTPPPLYFLAKFGTFFEVNFPEKYTSNEVQGLFKA